MKRFRSLLALVLLLALAFAFGVSVRALPPPSRNAPASPEQLKKVAAQGNAEAQFYMGCMHAEGNGVGKDESKAIEWLAKAATQKNTRAMGMLASLLFSRNQGEKDLIDAYVWSHLAAEYDPIQSKTSARFVIEEYCNEAQVRAAKKSMADWKRKWKSIASD